MLPGLASLSSRERSSAEAIFFPAASVTTIPGASSAASAGEPGCTSVMTAPFEGRPLASAVRGSMLWMVRPIRWRLVSSLWDLPPGVGPRASPTLSRSPGREVSVTLKSCDLPLRTTPRVTEEFGARSATWRESAELESTFFPSSEITTSSAFSPALSPGLFLVTSLMTAPWSWETLSAFASSGVRFCSFTPM